MNVLCLHAVILIDPKYENWAFAKFSNAKSSGNICGPRPYICQNISPCQYYLSTEFHCESPINKFFPPKKHNFLHVFLKGQEFFFRMSTLIEMQGPNDMWVGGRGQVCDSFAIHFVAACIIVQSAHIKRTGRNDEKCYTSIFYTNIG